MKLNTLPFHIGVTEQAANPASLPNTYPFELIFDSCLVLVTSLRLLSASLCE